MTAPVQDYTTATQLIPRMIQAAHDLEESIGALKLAGAEKARTEWLYRRWKSEAQTRIAGTEMSKNADTREAAVSAFVVELDGEEPTTVGILRYKRDLAAELAQAELEAVRSRRGILSGFQSVANALREEAAFARTGPDAGTGWQ